MQNARSISETSPFTTPEIGVPGQPARLHVVSRGKSRASNDALAWLATADVTPTGYRVGKFLAHHARYATAADVRRRVNPGEVFTYWPQSKMATELGCSERQVQRGIRSLREAGALDVRQRVRPCEASYVLLPPVGSGVGSGVGSHTEPRTEPRTEEKVRTVGKPTTFPSKRAEKGQTKQQRLVAAVCWKLGFWPSAARLEEFDGLDNPSKQALITRLLRVEARHDRRVPSGTPPPKTPNKTKAPDPPSVPSGTQRRDTAELPTAGKFKTDPNGSPAGKTPKKTKGKTQAAEPNGSSWPISAKLQISQVAKYQGRPRSGRLLAEYAERLRVARKYQRSDGSWANLTGGAV